jgi:uncharacterized membrane protein YfcA
MDFALWQWALLFFAAFLVGVSKTGIAGLGILFVALFANIFPGTKQSSGVVLPLLIAGDLIAVLFYRRHMVWSCFRQLFPWAAAGVAAGYFAMDKINDAQARTLIGGIILALTALHVFRNHRARRTARREASDAASSSSSSSSASSASSFVASAAPAPAVQNAPIWFSPILGILTGFTTLVANAAGPVATIFLLTARLPKLEFVGTAAVFFMLLNWFKVPFMVELGLVNAGSLKLNAILIPAVFLGALAGRWILPRVNQTLFENIALWLGALAGAKLAFF